MTAHATGAAVAIAVTVWKSSYGQEPALKNPLQVWPVLVHAPRGELPGKDAVDPEELSQVAAYRSEGDATASKAQPSEKPEQA